MTVRRDLVFMCAHSGVVFTLDYAGAVRPFLLRGVVFLASGETLWVTPPPAPGGRTVCERNGREDGRRYLLRVSAQAALLPGAAEIADGEPAAGRAVPVTIDVTLEPVSMEITLADRRPPAFAVAHVTMLRGTGSLAVGSVIYRLSGSGWASFEQPGDPGHAPRSRARAVFQDGSGLFATHRPGAGPADVYAAALVVNTQIRQVPVHQFAIDSRGRRAPQMLSWTGGGRSPVDVTGEIRDVGQYLAHVPPARVGHAWPSWACAPFVFVRSGITGLGLAEYEGPVDSGHEAAETRAVLPDPY
jgi:hypothetical protein